MLGCAGAKGFRAGWGRVTSWGRGGVDGGQGWGRSMGQARAKGR